MKDQPADNRGADEPMRRPYVAPELIDYGTVAKLTQTGGRTTADFLFNLRGMPPRM